jgi:two-component system, LytTR family, response regulator
MYKEQFETAKQEIEVINKSVTQSEAYSENASPEISVKTLLIEPDEEMLSLITFLLKNEKYEVIRAKNNLDGIKSIRLHSPDLVIWNIDLLLANEDEVKNKISYLQNENHVPLIILANKPSYHEFRKIMKLGADDYVAKPYDATMITQTVCRLIERYRNIRNRTDLPFREIKRKSDNILIRNHGKITPIPVNSILYISVEKHYSKIFVENNKQYIIKKALSRWEQIVPPDHFIRIHRSVLVNMNKIKEVKRINNNLCNVYLYNSDKILELTRNYFKNLKSLSL